MWEIGDLALCISAPQGDFENEWKAVVGGIYTVCEVLPEYEGLNFCEDFAYSEEHYFAWVHFAKINPLTKEEENEFRNSLVLPEEQYS